MYSYTQNNALTYSSTGCRRVDFFFKVTRDCSIENLTEMLQGCWEEHPLDTLKLIFHLRDCRGGKGEKKQFHNCVMWLLNKSEIDLQNNLHAFPIFGYYKDLLVLLGSTLQDKVLDILVNTLEEDKRKLQSADPSDKYGISLVSKWIPSEGCAYDRKFSVVSKLSKKLHINKSQYRKDYVVPLRTHLKIVEQTMCARQWDQIDFSKIPSVALFRYKKAFKKRCPEHYQQFLDKVKSGRSKMNTKQLHPHEIIKPYFNHLTGWTKIVDCPIDETIEITWTQYLKGIKERINGRMCRSMAVVDVSGSMSSNDNLPYRVAISLGLIISELSPPPFHHRWITFSAVPCLETLTGDSVHQQISNMLTSHWEMNTNLQAVFDLILNTAQTYQVPADKMIESIYILSDMQFDVACPENDKTNLDIIEQKYKESGYNLPRIIYWNIDSKNIDFPCTNDRKNIALISGFSPDVLDLLIEQSDISPYSIMRKAIDNPRYDIITYNRS